MGKGTQGKVLADALGWEHLATGDLLRAARRAGTELGEQARSYMDAGELVPDELIVALVREHIQGLSAETGVALDGFPRTVPQAQALDEVLPEVGRTVDAVLLLEAPDDVLIKRVAGRRSCPDCGRIYNVHYDPPTTEGLCDDCGSRLSHRDDDRPETVKRRLEVYQEQTRPLVAYYRNGPSPVIRVDGDQSMDGVQTDIRSALERTLGVGG